MFTLFSAYNNINRERCEGGCRLSPAVGSTRLSLSGQVRPADETNVLCPHSAHVSSVSHDLLTQCIPCYGALVEQSEIRRRRSDWTSSLPYHQSPSRTPVEFPRITLLEFLPEKELPKANL